MHTIIAHLDVLQVFANTHSINHFIITYFIGLFVFAVNHFIDTNVTILLISSVTCFIIALARLFISYVSYIFCVSCISYISCLFRVSYVLSVSCIFSFCYISYFIYDLIIIQYELIL